MAKQRRLFTLGHSNRSESQFVELLRQSAVDMLVDIRRFPRSRRNPHFNKTSMSKWLSQSAIQYRWLGEELGGFRTPLNNSQHTALETDSFRGFADYMSSEQFCRSIQSVLALEPSHQVAIMCAEAKVKSCHRQFISDYLVQREVTVTHILDLDRIDDHVLSDGVRVDNGRLIYDRGSQSTLF